MSFPRIVRSLRWRLQIWQGVILLLVVAGFGSVLYAVVAKNTKDEIDAELLAGARVLEGALRGFPRPFLMNGELPFGPPPPGPPPHRQDGPRPPPGIEDFRPPPEFPPPGRRPDDFGPRDDIARRKDFGPREGRRPPEEYGSEGDQPRRRPSAPFPGGAPARGGGRGDPEEQLRMLDLPYDLQARYGESRMPPFFIIWRDDGSVLKVVGLEGEPPPRPHDLQPDRVARLGTAGMREVALLGPGRTTILVGRSIEREQNEMVRLAGQLIFIGVATLVIGLAGGWWLSSRAVAPLESMSQTAASITASNLSKRLDAARLDTELQQLAEILNAMLDRLEAAFRQQVQFTADASHELRTPLSVILTHLEIALSRTRSVEEYREALSVCLRAAQRMKALTENLLTLARADSGRLGLQRRNVDVAMIARECAALLGPLANDRSVSVAVSDGPCEASVDADRIAQVITNLVSNAISYNRPGGTVMIMTSIREDELEIKVTDTGHGIPSQYLPHLFDRFYRMDESRARATGGAGLGLAICKSIVEAHGGRISAESKPDQGATFTILMPAR